MLPGMMPGRPGMMIMHAGGASHHQQMYGIPSKGRTASASAVQRHKQQPVQGPAQVGVGLYFKLDNMGRYYVEMVLPKSSAEATGVVAKGDILEVVDTQSTEGVSLPQLRDMILGAPGSFVNLTFLREKEGEGFRYDIDLIRGDPNRFNPDESHLDIAVKMGSQKSVRSVLSSVPAPAPTMAKDYPPTPLLAMYGEPDAAALMHKLLSVEAECDGYKRTHLAQQHLHTDAERELQNQREQISSLQKIVTEMQANTAKAAVAAAVAADVGPLDPARALKGGYVPKQDLISAMQRSQMLENELLEAEKAAGSLGGDSVPRAEYEAIVRKSNDLEQELHRQISIVQSHETGPGNNQIERMCVMALPAAVSALHSLSEETGHASSATWALVRAEDYVAHLASSRYPLSIPELVNTITNGANPQGNEAERNRIMVDTQDACLAMSVISWDPEGRNMLLCDSRTVPSLLRIVAQSAGIHSKIDTSGNNAWGALQVPAQVVCSRFAAMTLGNFSLDEGGRLSIVRDADAMSVLLEAISGDDTDTSSFSLLCAGNLFMISEARQRFLTMGDAVQTIFNKLSSGEAMTIRFAAGAVRNFAADDACREAVTKVRGSVAILQELSRNMNPRIRDHAEHALFNLRMLRHGGTGGGGSVHSTPVFGSETPRGTSAQSVQQGDNRSAFENIGANLFGMA